LANKTRVDPESADDDERLLLLLLHMNFREWSD